MQSIVEYTAGRRDTATALLRQATVHAESAAPRRRAWAAANLAHALTAGGDRAGALALLDQSACDLDRANAPGAGPVAGLDFLAPWAAERPVRELATHVRESRAQSVRA